MTYQMNPVPRKQIQGPRFTAKVSLRLSLGPRFTAKSPYHKYKRIHSNKID